MHAIPFVLWTTGTLCQGHIQTVDVHSMGARCGALAARWHLRRRLGWKSFCEAMLIKRVGNLTSLGCVVLIQVLKVRQKKSRAC